MRPLQAEFDFFNSNREALVSQYPGKYIVIKNNSVIGAFDDTMSAIETIRKTEPLGTFLVQFCDETSKNPTQMFFSRVSFAG